MRVRALWATPRRRLALAGGAFGGLAAGLFAWGVLEAHLFTVRRRSLVVAGPDDASLRGVSPSLRVLHLSDIHLLARQKHKIEWLRKLADSKPDFVILTGDQLSRADAYPALLEALEPLSDVPGAFVFGSHDYHSARPGNPLAYVFRRFFASRPPKRTKADRDLPWQEMAEAFERWGWVNLNNARGSVRVAGWNLSLVGVDDPHIHADVFPRPEEHVRESVVDLRIGVAHAPYSHVLDEMKADDCDLVFAGHTHGGQVCLPTGRALVSNCDLSPELASGMFTWPVDRDRRVFGDGAVVTQPLASPTMWVNVSAGLGTSPYAPVRLFCRPEAVQLDLIRI